MGNLRFKPNHDTHMDMGIQEFIHLFNDPAELLIALVAKGVEFATTEVTGPRKMLCVEDLKSFTDNSSDATKKFARFAKSIMKIRADESTSCTLNDKAAKRPPGRDLCMTLETKLNNCHRGEDELFQQFTNSLDNHPRPVPKFTLYYYY